MSVVGIVISIPTREETKETVNHTQRIAHVARQRRALTQAVVREAVERYFEALADDIASGEWVDLPDIGKIQVIQEEANGTLTSFGKDGKRVKRHVTHRLRTKVRLYDKFKARCKE
ncbi:MAG: HU family DNA-binding protein [Chloroflexota bacterium]